jgi:hypothetical protein
MDSEHGEDRDRRIDRWISVAAVLLMVTGMGGLALAGIGYWTDRDWAIIAGYAIAAPLMAVYPTLMLIITWVNWRQLRRKRER